MVSSSNARNALRRSGQACGIAACLLGLFAASSHSFAQGARDICPKGYSIFQTVCLNEVTGDVVNQSRGDEAGSLRSPVVNPDKAPAAVKSGG
jgi:hypothetical protein